MPSTERREQRLFGPSDSPGLATGNAKWIVREVEHEAQEADLGEALVVLQCIGESLRCAKCDIWKKMSIARPGPRPPYHQSCCHRGGDWWGTCCAARRRLKPPCNKLVKMMEMLPIKIRRPTAKHNPSDQWVGVFLLSGFKLKLSLGPHLCQAWTYPPLPLPFPLRSLALPFLSPPLRFDLSLSSPCPFPLPSFLPVRPSSRGLKLTLGIPNLPFCPQGRRNWPWTFKSGQQAVSPPEALLAKRAKGGPPPPGADLRLRNRPFKRKIE